MFGPFERMVAGRYLRARKGERFVSIIAIFSLVGIALGVATLIVVTSVMSGFQAELVTRILGVNGHITVEAFAGQKLSDYQPLVTQIRALPAVASVTPVLDGQALLSKEGGGARGGLVRGITLDDLRALHPISDHIIAGSLTDFTGDDAIVVGVALANTVPAADWRSADGDLARGRGDRVRHDTAGARLQGGGDFRCRAERLQQQRGVPAAGGGAGVLPEAQCGDRDRDPAA